MYYIKILAAVVALALLLLLLMLSSVSGDGSCKVGWYSVESWLREGSSGIMANGEQLNDDDYVCACWHLDFNTKVEFTNISNGKSVIAICKDRGPNKRLVKKGRQFDLSKAAFSEIAELKEGVIIIRWKIIEVPIKHQANAINY